MAKQGKCDECRRIYSWPWDTPMNNAQCPVHHTRLKRCTSRARNGTLKYNVFNVTNTEVEVIHQRRRKATLDELTQMGPKVGPGTD